MAEHCNGIAQGFLFCPKSHFVGPAKMLPEVYDCLELKWQSLGRIFFAEMVPGRSGLVSPEIKQAT